jgi:hypothetical protein
MTLDQARKIDPSLELYSDDELVAIITELRELADLAWKHRVKMVPKSN